MARIRRVMLDMGRELLEETGCVAERMAPMFTMYTTPGFTDEKIHLFVASGLKMAPRTTSS